MKFLTMILMMGVLGAYAQSVRLGSVVMKDVIAVTNELDATAIAALNVETTKLYQAIAAIPAGSTARVDKVWGRTANYMDGDGVFHQNIPDYQISFSITEEETVGKIFTWAYSTNQFDISGETVIGLLDRWEGSESLYAIEYISASNAWFLNSGEGIEDSSGLKHWIMDGERFAPVVTASHDGMVYITYDRINDDKVIGKTVNTNGTVIIIGQTSDDAGTITQQVARAGSAVITNSFFGRAEAEAAINAIPLPPTNSVVGWLIYDTGSNMWLNVSSSNFSFTVHEVL